MCKFAVLFVMASVGAGLGWLATLGLNMGSKQGKVTKGDIGS